MARPKLHDENLRQRLLDAATDLVAKKGDTFALRPLAESMDTSTTAIYSLFGSRTALLDAVAEQAAASFAEAIDEVRHDDPILWMMGLAVAYRRWAQASPARFHIVSDSKVDTEALRAARSQSLEPLREAVRQSIDEDFFEGDIDDMCTLYYAGVHGFIVLELMGEVGGDDNFHTFVSSLFWAHATQKGRRRLHRGRPADLLDAVSLAWHI